jgi:hypothetical protein
VAQMWFSFIICGAAVSVGLVLTIILLSKQFEYYTIINEEEIRCYSETGEKVYQTKALSSYKLLGKRWWFNDGIHTYQLIFSNNESALIKSFKNQELQKVLDKIIADRIHSKHHHESRDK